MDKNERDEFVDLVAQAVIDRMEERDKAKRFADVVIARIAELHAQEAAAYQAEQAENETKDNADEK